MSGAMKTKLRAPVLLSALLLALPSPAFAARTDWAETEGGAMRIVATRTADGGVDGVLEVMLDPGWKTYWRDPGDGGIPPMLTLDGKDVALAFPAPERIEDNGQVFSGYHTSVSLPFHLAEAGSGTLNFDAFIGLCREVCIPFQANLPIRPDDRDGARIENARKALPAQAGDDRFSVSGRDGDVLALARSAPVPSGSELFVAPPDGVALTAPLANGTGFTVSVRRWPLEPATIVYTLVLPDGSAEDGAFEITP